MAGLALLSAGGTGGHLFPAESLALALRARGWTVHLATDHRAETYGGDFPADAVHIIPSAKMERSPIPLARALFRLATGILASRMLVRRLKPDIAVGFGGYPTVPPMLAASRARVPTIIHEQNAVIGRANKYLAPRVTRIATSFAKVGKAEIYAPKMTRTGNPVRPAVLAAAAVPFAERGIDDPFNLLVFGGSQGARVMAELVPPAIAALDASLRARLRIAQQCRPEDMERVGAAYKTSAVAADLQPFFRDLPARIAASHLVVSRAGASTVAELGVIGRPAIMIPLPHALDQDQLANARVLSAAGGGWVVEQSAVTPASLAADIAMLIRNPPQLAAAAAAARTTGRPDAVDRLADLVEQVAASGPQVILNQEAIA
jgi:UDP-N-acetylglucosamine--N-acetylmuramyl-(pentapeptide) pyrophosphoryl-undecaprenol N-acetylglucosamine transferase